MAVVLKEFYQRHVLRHFVLNLMLFVQYCNVRGNVQFVPSFTECRVNTCHTAD
jgi:hypothetical protein